MLCDGARILFRRSTRGTVLALVHFAVLRKGSDKDSRASVDARLGISAFSSTGRPTGHAVAASSRSFVKRPDWG